MKQMLLLSNSAGFNAPILEYCREEVLSFLSDIDEVLLIPYAKKDYDTYTDKVAGFFKTTGVNLVPIHRTNHKDSLNSAKAIYIPGGNTFRLLDKIIKQELLGIMREKILNGTKYIGSSVGSAIASPTIMTTNDMPIVYPPSFNSLNLITFQLNCHYLDKDPNFPHNGESREARIQEYHEENDAPVIGLRENSWLECVDREITLRGESPAILFRKGEERKEIKVGEKIEL